MGVIIPLGVCRLMVMSWGMSDDGGYRLGWGAGVAPNMKSTIYALISGLVGKMFEDLKSS